MWGEREGQKEIRCFCSREPLLAMSGRDKETGAYFVWVKHSKGGKIVVDVMMTQGSMRIRCRECGRVHNIAILPDRVKVAAS